MFCSKQFRLFMTYCKRTSVKENLNKLSFLNARTVHTNRIQFGKNKSDAHLSKEMIVVRNFEYITNKNKESYLDMVKIYLNSDVHRRGHVEFIYSALKNMEMFGVHKDLEVYKSLVDILPKGKFIPENIVQSEFMHYPKQQYCIVDLLEQMEEYGVIPDMEMESMLLNIFGKRGHPIRKYWRMMYWMPKFKNLSPWPVPNPPPSDAFELAQLAIARISSVDVQTKVTTYQSSDIPDSLDDTWIISSQSPIQKRLLNEHNQKEPIYIEGSFKVWLRNKAVNYFILRANPNPQPVETELEDPDDVSKIKFSLFNFMPQKKALVNVRTVHEQDDGVILAICATGTSSKDSLLSWIRHLEKEGNPTLSDIPVVFTLKTAEKGISTFDEASEDNERLEGR